MKCNLKVLLAERNLKITQVSNDTGISRTTLTSLSNGEAKGIQFSTLETLCNYLNITANDLFQIERHNYTMTLEEAIRHTLEKTLDDNLCEQCRMEHEQLYRWLVELRNYRNKEL